MIVANEDEYLKSSWSIKKIKIYCNAFLL